MKSLRANGGYTLVEVLGYATILGVLLNFSAAIMLTGTRVHTLGTLALDQNEVIAEVVRDFREVAAHSDESGVAVPGISMPPATLVLVHRIAGDETQFALWRNGENHRLYLDKYLVRPGRPAELIYRKAYSPSLRVLKVASSGDGAVVRMQFEVDNAFTPRTVPRLNSVVATLRGH